MRCVLNTEFGYYKRIHGKPEWVEQPEQAQVFNSIRKVRDLIGFLGRNVRQPVIEVLKDEPVGPTDLEQRPIPVLNVAPRIPVRVPETFYLRACAQALICVDNAPLPLTGAVYDRVPRYARFVSFLGWLAVMESPNPFPLPADQLAALLSHDLVTLNKFVEWALRDGLLRLDPDGNWPEKQYRFAIQEFAMLQEHV